MGMSPAESRTRSTSKNSVRDELRDLTRQRILSGAQVVFERDGYSAATVGSITDEARVNRATFYHHFADKTELLAAVWQNHLDSTPEYWHVVDEALAKGDVGSIRGALDHAIEWYELHGKIIPAVSEAVAIHPDFMRDSVDILPLFPGRMTGFLEKVAPEKRIQAKLRLQLLVTHLDQIGQRVALGLPPSTALDLGRDALLNEIAEIWVDVLLGLTAP